MSSVSANNNIVVHYLQDARFSHIWLLSWLTVVNPRRACAARVTVLCLFVCLSVCLSVTTLQASVVDRTLKFRHQRRADDTLECFDSWILLTMLASRVMANFVSQEAYERASLTETSAHVITCRVSHVLLQFVIKHVLFFQSLFLEWASYNIASSVLCIRAFSRWLSHLSKSSSMPLCKACPGCGGMVHIRKVSCSCSHVFVAKHK